MSDASTAVEGVPVTQQWSQRENLADFVAHKREIFLVQMSLDTKRAEIRKMEVITLPECEKLHINTHMNLKLHLCARLRALQLIVRTSPQVSARRAPHGCILPQR